MILIKELKRHYIEIKKNGFSEFNRKFKWIISKTLNLFFIILFVPPIIVLLILISKFINFRFGIIRSSRIGHFIANTELYLIEKKLNKKKNPLIIDLLAFDGPDSNKYISSHYKKILKIYPKILIKPFSDFINFFKKNNYIKKFYIKPLGGGGDRDLNGYLYKFDNSLKFNHKELSFIENDLNKLGLDFNSKFVCLTIRDDAYLKEIYPKGNWDQSYRNWKISRFLRASESLTKRGYKVLRMGKIVKDNFVSKNPMILDYANSPYRSDVLDVYLHTRCFFTATSGTGIDTASYVSRRPMAWISVPVWGFYNFKNHFHATKHHKYKNTGKKLTLSEIFENNDGAKIKTAMIDEETYKNVDIDELNEIEIENYLLEVLDILENKFVWSKEDRQLQTEFWNNYKRLIQKHNYGYLHKNYEALIGPVFLRNNLQLLK